MTDLIDEIQEDLKEERYSKIVKRFAKIFSILSLVIVLITAVYVWKEHASTRLQHQLSISFNKAIIASQEAKFDEAITFFDEVISHSHQQYAALAMLHKAAIFAKQNKFDKAEEVLKKIIYTKHFDVAFRELAQIILFGNKLSLGNVEEKDISEIVNLTKDSKTWQVSAQQLKALYDLKQGKLEDAQETLKNIIGLEQASRYSRDTATSILAVISRSKQGK